MTNPADNAPARFIDVHVLQSVPVSALNRDDLNAIKSVEYGGVRRTRVSSQCWKRALRENFQDAISKYATRTRRIAEGVANVLTEKHDWPEQLAQKAGAHVVAASGIAFEVASESVDEPGTTSSDKESANTPQKKRSSKKTRQPIPNKVTNNGLVYLTEGALEDLAEIVVQHRRKLEKAGDITGEKQTGSLLPDDVRDIIRRSNAVIGTFGRMLSEVDQAGVDGAVQVAHALTTHRSDIQVDYFGAVDDLTAEWGDSTGSGYMDEAEFSAGTFYRFGTIDLRELRANMGKCCDAEDPRVIAGTFLGSFIRSLPQAKKNSTAPHTAPDLVHIAVRADRPLSFAAAFETPVRATRDGGHGAVSRTALTEYADTVTKLMGRDRILAARWAGTYVDELEAFGTRMDSYDALVESALDVAFTTDGVQRANA